MSQVASQFPARSTTSIAMALRTAIVALFIGLLAGCGGDGDFADIKEFMAEVDARGKSRIPPLPPFETVPPFAYQASDKRSPFEPPVLVAAVEPRRDGVRVEPNFNRVKQFLEQFQIGSLGMVGTLSQGRDLFALVRDPEGGVHRVSVGDYMGTDHGEVISIEDGAVELIEIVPDGTGGWVERARNVSLGGVE
ncbi:MAG: pilus assembly protein PilP [Pseudomonadaceae bacterium]|nr:pilus assembly protein PilP [Pseudomonadaceae bacterium]